MGLFIMTGTRTLCKCIYIFFTMFVFMPHQQSYAQQAYMNDDEVSTVFVSGGYGALFGAAMGAALLPFMNNTPMQNFRIVAGGASVGFMLGSAYGFYTVANANKNSFFNYSTSQDDDSGSFYSMPPTMPTQGHNLQNSAKKDPNVLSRKPFVGALIRGEGKNLGLAFPYFWVGEKRVGILLADINF